MAVCNAGFFALCTGIGGQAGVDLRSRGLPSAALLECWQASSLDIPSRCVRNSILSTCLHSRNASAGCPRRPVVTASRHRASDLHGPRWAGGFLRCAGVFRPARFQPSVPGCGAVNPSACPRMPVGTARHPSSARSPRASVGRPPHQAVHGGRWATRAFCVVHGARWAGGRSASNEIPSSMM